MRVVCFLKQRVVAFIDEESNRIPPQSRRFRAVAERKTTFSQRVRSRSGSVESTHVHLLRDPFKVGTVTGVPLGCRTLGLYPTFNLYETRVLNVCPLRTRISEVCALTQISVCTHTLFLGFLFCNIIESVLQIEILFYNKANKGGLINPPNLGVRGVLGLKLSIFFIN